MFIRVIASISNPPKIPANPMNKDKNSIVYCNTHVPNQQQTYPIQFARIINMYSPNECH